MKDKPIWGKLKLASQVACIPDEGLNVSKLRVEVSEQSGSSSAWIAELNVFGDLPWLKGEEREIELRVMSSKFRSYVQSQRPDLVVKRCSEVIGHLNIS